VTQVILFLSPRNQHTLNLTQRAVDPGVPEYHVFDFTAVAVIALSNSPRVFISPAQNHSPRPPPNNSCAQAAPSRRLLACFSEHNREVA